jgi:transketolase
MEINEATIKMWSRIGSRATFGMAALELGSQLDDLIILTGDTSTSAGLQRFKSSYPDKFLDVGIAEQNMIGIAAGLASEGNTVFTSTFAPFQTMRCCEQIKVNLGYMRHKVNMVGLASGVILGTLGYTHCCIEDVSIMRSIPNISVISPADSFETYKATLACVGYKESVYIRLTGGSKNNPVYKEDYDFEIGKAVTLREGNDITIISSGTMVFESLKAADLLMEKGISSTVVNMHTIKPLDSYVIEKASLSSKLIVTVEEHSIIGGLGTAVSEVKTKLAGSPPQLMIGLPDQYDNGGEYKDILERHGLSRSLIAKRINNEYKEQIKGT